MYAPGLQSTSFGMYCTTQGVYRNRVSVYICMFEAVEYEASENVTPCSGCFNKWCFSVWNLRRLNDGRRDINNVCRRTTFSRECIPVGCVPPASVAVSGVGVHSEGVCPGEGCVQGGGLCRGVSAQGGVHPHYMLGYTSPPPVKRMNDRQV